MNRVKVALVGAGSMSFALGSLHDLVLSERLRHDVQLEVVLMDISEEYVAKTFAYATEMFAAFHHPANVWQTTVLEDALAGADFVIVAIEVRRYHYWSQDFHIPRRYGSKQIYGENGGPGSMFHTLRNFGPMLHIARTMERLCPQAWLINFTNPEAKLVEAISKLTSVKVVGLCHGIDMGMEQLKEFLQMDVARIGVEAGGLNHFGFFTKMWDKETGDDLYPLFYEREKTGNLLAHFDHMALSRAMYHMYGYYPYPGTNHIGEYISYAEDFYAGKSLLYRYDPLREQPWAEGARTPDFVYSAGGYSLDQSLFAKDIKFTPFQKPTFPFQKENVRKSGENAIPIIEAITFDTEIEINAANLPNRGAIRGLPDDMVVETQAIVNGAGVVLKPMTVALPTAILGTINIQGTIHQLLIEAYVENSKTKLLQAVLLDPQAPSYYQACAMIDEMCELQKEILPPLEWKS